jgi:hypothetical protein
MNKNNAMNTIGRITVCIVLVASTLTLLNSRPLNAETCKPCADLDNPTQHIDCEKKHCPKPSS